MRYLRSLQAFFQKPDMEDSLDKKGYSWVLLTKTRIFVSASEKRNHSNCLSHRKGNKLLFQMCVADLFRLEIKFNVLTQNTG